jgi:hypothetical protein
LTHLPNIIFIGEVAAAIFFVFPPCCFSAQQDSIAPLTSVDSIETILQVDSIQQELNFIAYLNNRGENRDALLALKRLTMTVARFSDGRTDTINFFYSVEFTPDQEQ